MLVKIVTDGIEDLLGASRNLHWLHRYEKRRAGQMLQVFSPLYLDPDWPRG